MNQLERKIKKYIRSQHLLTSNLSVLLAVSGGVDSMVMLHLFSVFCERMKLQLFIIHVNHQLRGDESAGDENFVREMAECYGIPFFGERVDVKSYAHEFGLSKQVAARRLRYECFERLRRQLGSDAVATAHHADDNAETVLLNIIRGTGSHGLSGIPPKREPGPIVRPLLCATRKEIEAYADEQGIKYRNDSSNRSLAYRRNELRHTILPTLQKRHPFIIQTLNSVAEIMLDVNEKMRSIVHKTMAAVVHKDDDGQLVLNIRKLNSTPDFLQAEIFVELLRQMDLEPSEKKVSALHRLCGQPTGRKVELNGRIEAYRDRDFLVLKRTNETPPRLRQVEMGKSYDYQQFVVSISTPEGVPSTYAATHEVEYIDADRLGEHLILRSWHNGDWFIPLGMKERKKLSDFFTDQKVPKYQKSSIPVLESDGRIVWICGKRLDDRFKLTDRTQTAIRLTCQPLQRASHV